MHRNTYILVSGLAVLAALVVGVNVGKKLSPAAPQSSAKITPSPVLTATPTSSEQLFTDTACGFSLQYGSTFTLIDSGTGSAVLNSQNSQSQSIVMTCQKNILLPSVAPDTIQSLFLPTTAGASVSAKLYISQTNQDGTPINALLFTHPTNKLDVFIAGYGDAYNALLKTIRIIP